MSALDCTAQSNAELINLTTHSSKTPTVRAIRHYQMGSSHNYQRNGDEIVKLTVDLAAKSQYPDSHIKRGFDFEAAIQKSDDTESIPRAKALGMSLIGLFRDLNQFSQEAKKIGKKNPFLSYRSQGGLFLGADGEVEEFSKLNNGAIKIHVNSHYIDIIHKAMDSGFQIVFQNSGTPVQGLENGRVQQLFEIDSSREFHGSARYYPLPIHKEYQSCSDLVYRWIKMIVEKSGVTNAIWIGTQEPEHTLGYPNGNHSPKEGMNNLRNYAIFWSLLAKRLSGDGLLVGALQNNMATKLAGKSKYYLSLKELSDQHVPLDFFSIQNYQNYEESPPTKEIILSARNALAQFPEYKSTKILFNRYEPISSKYDNKSHNVSSAIVEALISEKQILNHSDTIYGYLIWIGWKEAQWEKLFGFLNSMPSTRLDVMGTSVDFIDAFAYGDAKSFSIAIWNSGKSDKNIFLRMINMPAEYCQGSASAIKGSGKDVTLTTLECSSKGIGPFTLSKDEYILISIRD